MYLTVPLDRIKTSFASDWSLTDEEAIARREIYGSNHIYEKSTNRWIELILDTVKDPMIWFLIGASLLFAIVKNFNQAIILLIAIVPLIGIDVFLHWRTQISTSSLSSRLASYTNVIRAGKKIKIPAWQIVAGDLIEMNAGMYFPADGVIIAGNNIQIDESTLTGESFPLQKSVYSHVIKTEKEIKIDSNHWGFAGTRLLTGQALVRIVYTGRETIYGKIIISAIQTTHAKTPLQKALHQLVFSLIIIATLACIILFCVRYLKGFGFVDALLSSATLAVAALPDEFPVVFTFFLGVGVYRLAQKKALVKRAVSVENIGRVTCICTDKTGTITEGQFKFAKGITASGYDQQHLLQNAAMASRDDSGDPLDEAILQASADLPVSIYHRVKSFPFTEQRKYEIAIMQQEHGNNLIVIKGAPETILANVNLTIEEKNSWSKQVDDLATQGYKIIACAQCVGKNISSEIEPAVVYEFIGLLAFIDPPRKGVMEAVKICHDSQIHVLMITGDHPETARNIAKEIGLGHGNPKVILAQDLHQFSKDNKNDFTKVDVIARAIPSEKYDIVKILQNKGEIVAVTGDGVNDVPALKVADIGISMGERGTQSAREVAAIVLLDDNFESIVHAISEGRQLFKNLKSSFKYLLIAHIPFVFSAAIIPLLGFPLLYYPIHIVWIELIIHPTSLLVFQDLPPSKKLDPIVRQSQVRFFSVKDITNILAAGLFATLIIIFSYIFILQHNTVEHARAFALGMLSFTSAATTLSLSGWRTWTARIVVILTLLFAIVIIQCPVTHGILGITALHLHDYIAITLSGLFVALLVSS